MQNSYLYDVREQIQNIFSECVTSEQYKTRVFEWTTKHAQEMENNNVYISDIIEIAQELSGEDW